MTDKPRLIEVAFPLKQASIDSVHEKNVRHGHISTLHIWPARRPLAACRAALIATLLPDPGNKKERDEILQRLGGRIVEKVKKKKLPGGKIEETYTEETEGGILHWGRESSADLDWFREKIKEAYGGRAPKVLDPFAGGGAIPLEAMRLGCEATAIDINPVAWFILKCTLEYPQKLAGQKLPLPDFVLKDRDFMESFFKAQGLKGASLKKQLEQLGLDKDENWIPGLNLEAATLEADLAWHVRAWGWWVLQQARKDLAKFYPTYADFEPLKESEKKWEKRELKRVPILEDGNLDLATLNQEFSEEYLQDSYNPRWVPKPTVAYLWARTVKCKSCRATIPLLKTRWLCKKDKKRVVLTMEPNAEKTGVNFGVQTDVPVVGGNTAQKRAHDKKIGAGTMSKSGASCPCCPAIMTMEDIRLEGKAGRLGAVMTAVIVDGQNGKEYHLPTAEEIEIVAEAENELEEVFTDIPYGLPKESIIEDAKRNTWCIQYGVDQFDKLFTLRQIFSLATLIKVTRKLQKVVLGRGYSSDWVEAISGYLALSLDRVAERNSCGCHYDVTRDSISGTFQRYALPINWDFCEASPISNSAGSYNGQVDWVTRYIEHAITATRTTRLPTIKRQSAIETIEGNLDIILTDPPYYSAIGYSVLMDFFYVWLRRILQSLSPEIDKAFQEPLSPKWNHEQNDGELIDDFSRFGGDKAKSKTNYEDGMFRVFHNCHKALKPEGRLVIVFAHKQPDAWETLVSAIIRAGFIVDASWPIQTEMGNRTRALSSAALSSSVWLVCKKRPPTARPGWDNRVFEEMRQNITSQLREFWDAGIRGPDFVWAATGPAMEAYSKYPVVKKANEPGQLLTVSEFLKQVRRIVLDFVVGRVLSETTGGENVSDLDDITTYYLLHRHDFKMEDAPVGACILYAVSCGLSDNALADQFDILMRSGGKSKAEEDEEEQEIAEDGDTETEEGTGSKVKLKPWQQRKRKTMGYEAAGGRPIPLIDQVHRLMHLWKAGDVVKVDEYLDEKGLRRHALFHQLLQALIELADAGSDERALLESISNHVAARSGTDQLSLPFNQ
jgi:putative DNA methylase